MAEMSDAEIIEKLEKLAARIMGSTPLAVQTFDIVSASDLRRIAQHLAAQERDRRGNCSDCAETPAGRHGWFRIGEYRCYYCKAWFCEDHAYAHFDDHSKGQQSKLSAKDREIARLRQAIVQACGHHDDRFKEQAEAMRQILKAALGGTR